MGIDPLQVPMPDLGFKPSTCCSIANALTTRQVGETDKTDTRNFCLLG